MEPVSTLAIRIELHLVSTNEGGRQTHSLVVASPRIDSSTGRTGGNDAIARGKRHPHAVRILARAWVRVIWRCWQDHTAYNPELHGGAIRLAAA